MATATITGYCSTVNARTGGVGSAVLRAPDTTTCSQHAQCCRVVTTGSWILRLSKTCSLQSMIVNLPLGQAAATVPVAPAVRAPAQKSMPTAGWHGAAGLRPGATVRTAAQMQRLADTVNGRCCCTGSSSRSTTWMTALQASRSACATFAGGEPASWLLKVTCSQDSTLTNCQMQSSCPSKFTDCRAPGMLTAAGPQQYLGYPIDAGAIKQCMLVQLRGWLTRRTARSGSEGGKSDETVMF